MSFFGTHQRHGIAIALTILAAASVSPAIAADGWEEAGSGAVAILPAPAKAKSIISGSLVCAEQSWSFRFRTEPRAVPAASNEATVTIGDQTFPEAAEQSETALTLPVSLEMLDAMRTGNRLVIALGKGEDAVQATFSLRNSKKIIKAVAPRCSQIDMSAFEAIALTDTDAAVETAKPLVADEIKQFKSATSATPTLTAKQIDRDGGAQMLFATLCGSKWYYGRSGCTLIGFLRASSTAEWQHVYDSEGMLVYLDPKASNGGWPNVVTLPMSGATAPLHWIFTGAAYELRDAVMAGDAPTIEGEGDIEQ